MAAGSRHAGRDREVEVGRAPRGDDGPAGTHRGVAQLAEHRSPKPGVAGSIPVSPASFRTAAAALLGALPGAGLLLDEAGTVLEAAPASAPLLGQPLERLRGASLFECFVESEALHALATRFRTGRGGTCEATTREGGERLHLHLEPLRYADARFGAAWAHRALPRDDVAAIADARHEINNLMMAVLGYAELLATHPGLPERARDRAHLLSEQAARLRTRLDELLQLSRRLTRALERMEPHTLEDKGVSHDTEP